MYTELRFAGDVEKDSFIQNERSNQEDDFIKKRRRFYHRERKNNTVQYCSNKMEDPFTRNSVERG